MDPKETQPKEKKALRENRLAKEKSPYLLQHKNNPVDWYPWGEEAFEKARKENKPIFLSVGYSTCHWCHVMERESFENEEIAKIMNEHFVNIKVDREERPDVDKIYLTYVQAITGSGGWPMSVWLTPDLKPFMGGTYFPPKSSFGRPGFAEILLKIAELWQRNRKSLIESGTQVFDVIREQEENFMKTIENPSHFTIDVLHLFFKQIERSYDTNLAGFLPAPKFPRPVVFTALFHYYYTTKNQKALEMCNSTLKAMYEGGIHDHIGGGFHRYSVTRDWHVPHFEKMLYDQGQLAVSYLTAYQITKNELFAAAARDILDYVIRQMQSPQGGFYSAEDADSLISEGSHEKGEGAFYVWSYDEIVKILGKEDANVFNARYGVKKEGNVADDADPHGEFVNKNILKISSSISELSKLFNKSEQEITEILERCRKKLFEVREKRPRPLLDDKIITAWNGLMISAFANASQLLDEPRYLDAGKRAAEFIKQYLYTSEGYLIRNYRDGPSTTRAFADDYAFFITALLDLYEASFEVEWLDWALRLQNKMDELFLDKNGGGYYSVDGTDTSIILRLKEDYDGSEPSNNSYAAMNLLRLAEMTGQSKWKEQAAKIFTFFEPQLRRMPVVVPHLVAALDFYLSAPKQIVLAGNPNSADFKALVRVVHSYFLPNKVMLCADGVKGQQFLRSLAVPAIAEGDMRIDGKATAYLCQNFTCNLPTNSPQQLHELLKSSTP